MNKIDAESKVLRDAVRAIERSTSDRMRQAVALYIHDRYVINPVKKKTDIVSLVEKIENATL